MVAEVPITVVGLSPRARGKLGVAGTHAHETGSIPACAGEAALWAWMRAHPEVYPRVRGGSFVVIGQGVRVYGLSPRARGKRFRVARFARDKRSIPACAGEAFQVPHQPDKRGVYPRVRGGSTPE